MKIGNLIKLNTNNHTNRWVEARGVGLIIKQRTHTFEVYWFRLPSGCETSQNTNWYNEEDLTVVSE